MKNKSDLIEYLTDILTEDPAKFMSFMGYDDIGGNLVEGVLNKMSDSELNDTVKWFSDDYDNIEEFDNDGY